MALNNGGYGGQQGNSQGGQQGGGGNAPSGTGFGLKAALLGAAAVVAVGAWGMLPDFGGNAELPQAPMERAKPGKEDRETKADAKKDAKADAKLDAKAGDDASAKEDDGLGNSAVMKAVEAPPEGVAAHDWKSSEAFETAGLPVFWAENSDFWLRDGVIPVAVAGKAWPHLTELRRLLDAEGNPAFEGPAVELASLSHSHGFFGGHKVSASSIWFRLPETARAAVADPVSEFGEVARRLLDRKAVVLEAYPMERGNRLYMVAVHKNPRVVHDRIESGMIDALSKGKVPATDLWFSLVAWDGKGWRAAASMNWIADMQGGPHAFDPATGNWAVFGAVQAKTIALSVLNTDEAMGREIAAHGGRLAFRGRIDQAVDLAPAGQRRRDPRSERLAPATVRDKSMLTGKVKEYELFGSDVAIECSDSAALSSGNVRSVGRCTAPFAAVEVDAAGKMEPLFGGRMHIRFAKVGQFLHVFGPAPDKPTWEIQWPKGYKVGGE